MDVSVQEAMRRWPNVPAVYGWMSLDARGTWRMHEAGDAQAGGPGGPVANAQLIAFIERNYEHDERGNWFFQNGPQRVYVRLDAAPYVLRLTGECHLSFETHTGLKVATVTQWLVDEHGRVFAELPEGGAIVADRDLAKLGEILCNPQGQTLIALVEDRLATDHSAAMALGPLAVPDGSLPSAPLKFVLSRHVPAELGFVANPGVDAVSTA